MSRKFYFSRDMLKSFLAQIPVLRTPQEGNKLVQGHRISVMSVDSSAKFEKFPVIVSYDLDLDMIIAEEDLE